MNKKTGKAFGKKIFLLGEDKEGTYYWLEEGSWDCDWYWGIGYVETYTNNEYPWKSKDISMHTHFDSLFKTFDDFANFFEETPFSEDEVYLIYEFMCSLYTARKYSDFIHCGGAHITSNPCNDIIKNEKEYERINKEVIPALLKELYKVLSE